MLTLSRDTRHVVGCSLTAHDFGRTGPCPVVHGPFGPILLDCCNSPLSLCGSKIYLYAKEPPPSSHRCRSSHAGSHPAVRRGGAEYYPGADPCPAFFRRGRKPPGGFCRGSDGERVVRRVEPGTGGAFVRADGERVLLAGRAPFADRIPASGRATVSVRDGRDPHLLVQWRAARGARE